MIQSRFIWNLSEINEEMTVKTENGDMGKKNIP